MSSATTHQDRSLLVVVLDISPYPWGERDLHRKATDRKRLAEGKISIGPATIEDSMSSVLTFVLAFSSLNRDNCAVVVGVADSEAAVLYPRKGGEMNLTDTVHDGSEIGGKVDAGGLHEGLKLGAADLVGRAAARAERAAAGAADSSASSAPPTSSPQIGASIASGISLALCVVNRFMVAAHGGVSALPSDHPLKRSGNDGGVLAALSASSTSMEGKRASRKIVEDRDEKRRLRGMPAPRVLVVQASEDRTGDYNALMNCAFAAVKGDVAIDGCFIPSGVKGQAKTSPFLEQCCDRTGGVFLTPSGAAQVGGALTEVMMTVFLPPLSIRKRLNLPALTKVDFRARCFEGGESVDIAHVCNHCLSIFKNQPKDFCPTCGAEVRKNGSPKSTAGREQGPKRIKQS